MPYIQRDSANKIIGVYANFQQGYAEEYSEKPVIDLFKFYEPLSALQVRKVLTQFGLRIQVETAISNADQATKDAWQFANDFDRNNPILLGMAQALGITDTQLDSMFSIGITL